MDLVDEEDLAVLNAAEDAREIEFLLQHGAGSLREGNVEFLRDDGTERGLAQTGWPVKQYVVERLTPLPRGVNRDLQDFFEPRLSGEVGQAPRTQTRFELLFFLGSDGRYEAGRLGHQRTNSSALRNSGSNSSGTPLARALRMAASAAGRAHPRFNRPDITSSSRAESEGAAGA